MGPTIRKYDPKLDYIKLRDLIKAEGDEWKDYLRPAYRQVLANSMTYVALIGDELCGYSGSINDSGLFVWVIDLLVNKNRRGHSIGNKLLDCILTDFPDTDIYVLSDVDGYYEKQGYKKEGSIFKIVRTNDKT